jgi:chemotaxis protein methyltransferase CheR
MMEQPGHHPLLPAFSESLARQLGMYFPQERWPDLGRGMHGVARDLYGDDLTACLAQLLSAPLTRIQTETLARHLSIGETYFFREPQVFQALQEHVLPPLIQARRQSGRHLRLWSAGCSTGEEAYSLAILLQRMIPDFQEWSITILATDINPQALEKAALATYGNWSFRGAPSWLRERYFRHVGKDRYELIPSVRSMVQFAYLNLAEDGYPALASNTTAMDIIFCRNVLMYFPPELAAAVVGKHYRALVENGWLVVSPSEISQPAFQHFVSTPLTGAILHQKSVVAQKSPVSGPASSSTLPAAKPLESNPKSARAETVRTSQAVTHTSPHGDEYEEARMLYRQGRYKEAAAATASLLGQRNDPSGMALMARIHANMGELETALHWCEQASLLERLDPAVHYLLGTILQELERGSEAMLAYKRTLYLDPDFALAHFALGRLYREQNKAREANKHFENALLLLGKYVPDEALPECDGMTAGHFMEIIRQSLRGEEQAA